MKSKIIKYLLSVLTIQLLPFAANAQTESNADPYFYDHLFAWGLGLLAATVAIAAVAALFNLLQVMIKVQQLRIYEEEGIEAFIEEVKKPKESLLSQWYKRLTASVPIEKEEDILFDHEYDGIRELDNSLPPWWVAMFYITIGIAVIYMGYYHVIGAGPSSKEEYEMEMEQAHEKVQAYLASQANQVDESNVTVTFDENDLAMGKTLYDVNCAACHGLLGEGGVGPNMTDEYWLHGGSVKDVFKTIKYGVPEKGMISWKSQMRAVDMQNVASYILSLQGTNPPNAKEPQGAIYKNTEEAGDAGEEEAEPLGLKE